MGMTHVPGENRGDIVLYALSTCVWCRKTKELLESLKVDFRYAHVDLLSGKEKDDAMEEVKKWNPRCSFPSLVVGNEHCIVGFDEKKIREAVKA
jgi:glutaredoxin